MVISPGRRGVVDRDATKGRASRLAPSPSISRARAAAVYYKLASTIHLSRAPGIPGPRRPSSTVPAGRGRAPAPRAVPGPATTSYRIPASSLARTTNLTRRCRRVRFVLAAATNAVAYGNKILRAATAASLLLLLRRMKTRRTAKQRRSRRCCNTGSDRFDPDRGHGRQVPVPCFSQPPWPVFNAALLLRNSYKLTRLKPRSTRNERSRRRDATPRTATPTAQPRGRE